VCSAVSSFKYGSVESDADESMIEHASATRPKVPGSNLMPSPFVRTVAQEVLSQVAKPAPQLHTEVRSRLAKFWYGDDAAIHYELSLHENTSQLEIGLHAEASAERNRAVYNALDRCLVEIQKELGTSMWLEEWDRGWIRLYETQPLWPLDVARASEVAARLHEIIAVVQPMYEALCKPCLK
jgi:hypothetical protein